MNHLMKKKRMFKIELSRGWKGVLERCQKIKFRNIEMSINDNGVSRLVWSRKWKWLIRL
jgi:hypothetical protein